MFITFAPRTDRSPFLFNCFAILPAIYPLLLLSACALTYGPQLSGTRSISEHWASNSGRDEQ